jgi:spermidine dehydrogenase
MDQEDRDLGMGRAISRRDFVNGAAMAAGAVAAMGQADPALAQPAVHDGQTPTTYPPLRAGFRGDYQGVYIPAHALRDGGKAPEGQDTGERYDLVIVGGGLSGIGAAWYYREAAGPSARILILENHDDFGGHAKRNEFVVGDKMFLAPGGSERLPAFYDWNRDASRLIQHFGINPKDPRDQTDPNLYRSMGMGPATFFRKEVFGKDMLVKGALHHPTQEFLAQAPLSPTAKADLWKLMSDPKTDYMPGLSAEEKIAKLRAISYRDYLLNYVKISPETLIYTDGVWCLSNDTASAWYAMFRHKPGFAGLGLAVSPISPENPPMEATNYYFPGGNHSICRMILRELIPGSLPPGDFIQVETERFDYSTLDRPGQPTRVRLNSTVVCARHLGPSPQLFDPDHREVEVTYVTPEGKALKVQAKDVIMAGNNNMIPYICPEIAEQQKVALHKAVRAINMFINVLLRDWTPLQKLGVSSLAFPRSFVDSMSLWDPRSFGALQASTDPSQPVLCRFSVTEGLTNTTFLEEVMGGAMPPPGTPMDIQMRAARAGLYRTPFERFEKAVRSQSAAALGPGGFDPARDILAITVNRWGHGYALPINTLFEDATATPRYEIARHRFGRIAIANSDASGVDTIETAFNEGARAVRDLDRRDGGRNAVI